MAMVILCPGFLTTVYQTLTLLQPLLIDLLASETSRAGPSMAQQSEPEVSNPQGRCSQAWAGFTVGPHAQAFRSGPGLISCTVP